MSVAVTAVFAAVVAPLDADAANVLVNPGFEDPVTMDGAPFVGFWESFNGGGTATSMNSTAAPRTGAQSLELGILDEANNFAGAFQDVDSLVPGQTVTFSGWHQSQSVFSGVEFRIEWRDSVNNVEISRTPNSTPVPGTSYEMFSLTDTVPVGADTARAVYALQSFGGPVNGLLYVDDTSFDVVPEPAAGALAAFAGIVCLLRRRR